MNFAATTAVVDSHSNCPVAPRSRFSLELAVLGIGLLFAGCRQSYAEGMQIVCDAPKYCCKGTYSNLIDKYHDMNVWLEARLKNDEAMVAYLHLSDIPPDQRPKSFLEAIGRAGIAKSDCPMALLDESWSEDGFRRLLKEGKATPGQ